MPPGNQTKQVTVASLSDDISRVSDLIQQLDQLVASFRHTDSNMTCELLRIHNLFIDIESQIELITTECSVVSVLSGYDSSVVLNHTHHCSKSAQVLLNDIGLSRIEFDHALIRLFSISPIVKGHLDKLQSLFESLFASLRKVLDKTVRPSLDSLSSKTIAAFDIQANVVYSQVCSVYSPYKISFSS